MGRKTRNKIKSDRNNFIEEEYEENIELSPDELKEMRIEKESVEIIQLLNNFKKYCDDNFLNLCEKLDWLNLDKFVENFDF